ncbi:hypothetical protein [Hymenobacter metallicola]|uniref:Lipocalin-like domain-containing protein n=1 Tax=Hymenobacter metallicola TaxID=2563114 RepID=A0A4Z0PVM8_9BACT|nr:hypothetical protein [Hymenobacter metallicola]TGE20903.1 hypothetical protein E5K02_25210 [Hymenobacter metallicola]
MSRPFPLLLLCLLLLTAACKKDTAEPAPVLEGRWVEQSHMTYTYDTAGKLLREHSVTAPTPRYGMVIQPTTWEWLGPNLSGDLVPAFTDRITRTGNMIYFTRQAGDEFELRILTLTAHTLTLRYEHIITDPTTGQYETRDDTFSR